MYTRILPAVALLLAVSLIDTTFAQQPTTNQKRQWLLNVISTRLADRAQREDAIERVRNMTPEQVDRFFSRVYTAASQSRNLPAQRQQLLEAEQRLAQARAYRDNLRRQLAAQRYGNNRGTYGNNVGYMPVITWLPEGAQLAAGAVVSPDRRYVRVNAQPFFSSVGPVHSFNFQTGETKLLPQYSRPPLPTEVNDLFRSNPSAAYANDLFRRR